MFALLFQDLTTGRLDRRRFRVAIAWLAAFAAALFAMMIGEALLNMPDRAPRWFVHLLATLAGGWSYACACVGAKRLRDLGLSGWWLFAVAAALALPGLRPLTALAMLLLGALVPGEHAREHRVHVA